jgi:23S rRNA (uracil1939-C5)-methyltransferase
MPQIIELTLDGIAHGGEALGRHAGKVVFVPYAIPGEHVRVEIEQEKARWARARLLEVLTPSPDRVEPPCPYFGPEGCGGCRWQHINYQRQATLSVEIVADQLRRLGRIAEPILADIVILADDDGVLDFGYRNHTQFAVTPDGVLGYRRTASHDVIPVERCLLLSQRLDELHTALDVAWPDLQGVSLRAGVNTEDALVILEAAGDDGPEMEIDLPASFVLSTGRELNTMIGDPWISERVAGRDHRISALSFFHVNTVGAEALVDLVMGYADLGPTDVVLDAYCGVGLFSLALADHALEVVGVESSPWACEDFAWNARDLPEVTLHEGAVEAVLPALLAAGQRVDVAVMDPPRSGAGQTVIEALAAFRPRKIIYLTSDPATLARDSVYLQAAGYSLTEATPVDLFPQTAHVEVVALWQRS